MVLSDHTGWYSESSVVELQTKAASEIARVFAGDKPGIRRVYIDNLRIRHADGSVSPLWTDGKDTRFRRIADSEFFSDARVRSVPANEVP